MPSIPLFRYAAFALLAASALASHAEPLAYNRVSLDVSAEQAVENDRLVVILTAQAEGRDATEPADEVNRQMDWAVNVARSMQAEVVQTLGYRTQPIYDEQRIRGWRVSQSLRLESDDSRLVGDLIARLQEQLHVQSLTYEVSPQARRTHVDRLTEEALVRFRERAEAISKAVGRSGYRIVRLQINDGHDRPVPMAGTMMMQAVRADAAVAPARIEAGTQTLQVTINGEIELNDS
jgi:predicted secreted protein